MKKVIRLPLLKDFDKISLCNGDDVVIMFPHSSSTHYDGAVERVHLQDFVNYKRAGTISIGNLFKLAPYWMTPLFLHNKNVELVDKNNFYVLVKYKDEHYGLHINSMLACSMGTQELFLLHTSAVAPPPVQDGSYYMLPYCAGKTKDGREITINYFGKKIDNSYQLIDNSDIIESAQSVRGSVFQSAHRLFDLSSVSVSNFRMDMSGIIIAPLPGDNYTDSELLEIYEGLTKENREKILAKLEPDMRTAWLKFLDVRKATLDSELKEYESSLKKNKDEGLSLQRHIECRIELKNAVNGDASMLHVDAEGLLKDGWTNISICNNNKILKATTPFIVMVTEEGQRYGIGKIDAEICMENMKESYFFKHGNRDIHRIHPHIFENHRPCLGNVLPMLNDFLLSGEIYGFMTQLLLFFQHYNPGSPAVGIDHFSHVRL